MKNYIKALSVLAVSALSVNVWAQETPMPDKKEKSIIIRKSGDGKEKTTIVIDGDKVTVNGKPVENFKTDDLEVTTFDGPGGDHMLFAPGVPPAMSWSGKGNSDMFNEIHSNKAFLGVMTKKVEKGAQITEVTKESAAEKAGLKNGDIITKVGDTKIENADDLYKTIGDKKPGDKIVINYLRENKSMSATAELGENKDVRVFSLRSDGGGPNFGMAFPPEAGESFAPFTKNFRQFYFKSDKPRLGAQVQDTEDSKGVKVLEVEDEGAGEKAGLEEDDVITSVNGKSVTSVDDLREAMADVKAGDTLNLQISRDGKSQTIAVKFPKELKTTDL